MVEVTKELPQNAASLLQRYNSGQMLMSRSNHVANVEMGGPNNGEIQSQTEMKN